MAIVRYWRAVRTVAREAVQGPGPEETGGPGPEERGAGSLIVITQGVASAAAPMMYHTVILTTHFMPRIKTLMQPVETMR